MDQRGWHPCVGHNGVGLLVASHPPPGKPRGCVQGQVRVPARVATVYYTATSLDGFIATSEDSVDWLDALPQPEDDTYTPFIEKVGGIAMGRSTYEFMLRHHGRTGEWPYTQPCWVFTHAQELPVPNGAKVQFMKGSVADAHRTMMDAVGDKDLWICGGGDLAGQFLDAGLLDSLVVTVASQTLGSGKPLLPRNHSFVLTSARSLGAGFAELQYRPKA